MCPEEPSLLDQFQAGLPVLHAADQVQVMIAGRADDLWGLEDASMEDRVVRVRQRAGPFYEERVWFALYGGTLMGQESGPTTAERLVAGIPLMKTPTCWYFSSSDRAVSSPS